MQCCAMCKRPFRKPNSKKQRFHVSMYSEERLQWSIDVLARAAERFPELAEACGEEQARLSKFLSLPKGGEL